MPSVRFARDKRGYEYVYLVHAPTRKGKPGKSRVLYWYRTPPGVRIGRKPFDEEVRRALEAQNPGLTFDWEGIIATPMPPPDMTEYWRERRRLEKAARLERLAEEALEAAASQAGRTDQEPSQVAAEGQPPAAAGANTPVLAEVSDEAATEEMDADASDDDEGTDGEVADATASPQAAGEARRKRRRRGGRRRRGAQRTAAAGGPQGSDTAQSQDAASVVESEHGAASVPAAASAEVDPQTLCAPDPAPDSQIAAAPEPGSSASEE